METQTERQHTKSPLLAKAQCLTAGHTIEFESAVSARHFNWRQPGIMHCPACSENNGYETNVPVLFLELGGTSFQPPRDIAAPESVKSTTVKLRCLACDSVKSVEAIDAEAPIGRHVPHSCACYPGVGNLVEHVVVE